ncbi:hypothetical protein A8C75_13235 [Marinobacterium aestuarii]|uniref:Uncharacterized protein n=1 Tax=Marinobacterium aestuarii TaxID=1821621 RepID=A0A1A9F0N4_9GAMM|nr:hypothetical protein [Marinobacterium aestuarii]ANG63339.1 hypothetical protein A8C75_13235 [Marinobacterium aestuarii]
MNTLYPHYNAHMNSALSYPGGRRESEIEYIFRIAREAEAEKKAELRAARMLKIKASLLNLLSKFHFSRTPSLHALLGR